MNLNRYFAADGTARAVIVNTINDAKTVRIATAYFRSSGYQCLREVLKEKEVYLLIGRPDTSEDSVREVIKEFMESIMTGPAEDRTAAIQELRNALENGKFLISVSDSKEGIKPLVTTMGAKYTYHHAKLYRILTH